MSREIITTDGAPAAIGPYSQAVRIDRTVYLSGQIPLHPETMELAGDDIGLQIKQVFDNLRAVVEAAGGSMPQIARLSVYLTDLQHFPLINEIMTDYFEAPYPARAAIGVAQLPKGAQVEVDAILCLPE